MISSICGIRPEQHSHISSVKGNYAFTRHQILGAKCLRREIFFLFGTKWSPNSVNDYSFEDLNTYIINEWVNERVKCLATLQSNFCPVPDLLFYNPLKAPVPWHKHLLDYFILYRITSEVLHSVRVICFHSLASVLTIALCSFLCTSLPPLRFSLSRSLTDKAGTRLHHDILEFERVYRISSSSASKLCCLRLDEHLQRWWRRHGFFSGWAQVP